MSNVGLVAMFYCGSDVFALTDQHVAPIYEIRLNMTDMLVMMQLGTWLSWWGGKEKFKIVSSNFCSLSFLIYHSHSFFKSSFFSLSLATSIFHLCWMSRTTLSRCGRSVLLNLCSKREDKHLQICCIHPSEAESRNSVIKI